MKRKFPILIIILIAVIACCFIGIYIFIDIKFGWQIWISRRIEILVPFSAELEYEDSHGGFHGDGECIVKVFFSEEQAKNFTEKIENNNHWKKLPMPERLQNCVSVYTEEGKNMPIIENGYWFYLDRNSEADNKYDENERYEEKRWSRNYSVAVFDSDENILYYYELDT
jgi:hypothetical protein